MNTKQKSGDFQFDLTIETVTRNNMTTTNMQVETIFRAHFVCWRIMGFLPTENYGGLYAVYSILVNVIITIGYPLHLMIGLFMSTTLFEIIKNVAVMLTVLVCSIKTVVTWLKFQNIEIMFDIIRRQNKRIALAKDESLYIKYESLKRLGQILKLFTILYAAAGVSSELSVLFNGVMGTWSLMYPAYFPFDPYASSTLYILAHIYQFAGVSFLILQDIASDSFAAMNLALLSGQLRTLSMRVAKLGTDKKKGRSENNEELLECIQDHKDLLQYRHKLEEIISFYMFFQILFTSINMCSTIAFLILFANDPFTWIYYSVYFLSMAGEIMPVCYYGTIIEIEFQNVTYAIFSSNWLEQDAIFKKHIRIFAEATKKPLCIMAWLFHINLSTFVFACKNAYSMFALIMNMK
ncbi:odorant receptor 33b-like [Calliphora vicina]|uniref:odorant receptor 33b-like n=1 Tax=Calliphora vicina TaxID=7373 RepID=UPI00325B3DED